MYREIERAPIEQNKKTIVHATLDTRLNVLNYSPKLRQWVHLTTDDLADIHLIDLFPQLEPHQQDIIQQLQSPEGIFSYPNAYFFQSTNPDDTFDLQIEPFPERPNRLLLTIVPVSKTADMANRDKNVATLARHNRELLLLNRASQILTATLDINEVLDRLLQVTVQVIRATGSSVWLWEDANQEKLICRAAFHPGTEQKLLGQAVHSGNGIVGWVAEKNEGTIVSDASSDGRFYPSIDSSSGFVTNSILAVPIHLRNRVLGVLEVVNKKSGRFKSQDLTYAQMLAASAAIAIDNAQLIQTLRTKMEDLKVQNAELAAFDHTVAHDLQNPLALVVGFADLLKTAENNITLEEQTRALELLVQNAHRMSNIIQELLVLSSVRQRDVDVYPLDMMEIVLNALDRLRFTIQKSNVRLILPESWPVASGYAPWIEEVWENYIGNALKYGGNSPKVELGSEILPDGRIKFWVRDNGEGIDPEKHHLLFTPFTQLSQVRATGHGLGLSIVRRIMEKLGGEVAAQSELGKGSTFSFILPAYHPLSA
ncbi:sensor histidine kinase [Candidatus Leptofilum sp.]|uniref:sensor histidine kinase n=1 Tax=Candidatus Leptofilum sp. TaxID=3241576 RepID=UPI003B594BCF